MAATRLHMRPALLGMLRGAPALLLALALALAAAAAAPAWAASSNPYATLATPGLPTSLHDAQVESVADSTGVFLSPVLPPSLVGVSIEPSNLLAFTGTSAPNALTRQLLANFVAWTGQPAHVRIGGDTGDNILFDAASPTLAQLQQRHRANASSANTASLGPVPDDQLITPTANPAPANRTYHWTVGPAFLQALDHLPPHTPLTYGLNLAYRGADRTARAVAMANATLTLLHNATIVAFELGNEPDRYNYLGYRPSSWTEDPGFGPEWSQLAQAVSDQALAPRGIAPRAFEPATTADPTTAPGTAFQIRWLAWDQNGVAAHQSQFIAAFSEHDYFTTLGQSPAPITQSYMLNLNNTAAQLAGWVSEAREAAKHTAFYHLGEVGSVGPQGLYGVSDTFANTLWTFHFYLYAASRGVTRINLHMTQGGAQSPWQPIPLPDHGEAQVRSPYYALAAIAQITEGGCSVRIAQVPCTTTGGSSGGSVDGAHQAVFTIYDGSNLRGWVLINSSPFNSSAQDQRPYLTFRLGPVPYTTSGKEANEGAEEQEELNLSWLWAPGTDDRDNTSWNGMTFDPASGQPRGAALAPGGASNAGAGSGSGSGNGPSWSRATVTLEPTDQGQGQGQGGKKQGIAQVDVPDGSAVVVTFGQRLGAGQANVNPDACRQYEPRLQQSSSASVARLPALLPLRWLGFGQEGASLALLLCWAVGVWHVVA